MNIRRNGRVEVLVVLVRRVIAIEMRSGRLLGRTQSMRGCMRVAAFLIEKERPVISGSRDRGCVIICRLIRTRHAC
jgi:hypothetical protein